MSTHHRQQAEALLDALADIIACAAHDGHFQQVELWNSVLDMYLMATEEEEEHVIAVYGTTKQGKSTLLNSIVGADILPRDRIPVTGALIDLHREADDAPFYEVCCYQEDNLQLFKIFATVEETYAFLDMVAGQKQAIRYTRVTVSGPFPKAYPFFRKGCTLRDTPGASVGNSPRERQQWDSQVTLSSLKGKYIPLFCVSVKSLAGAEEAAFYKKHFSNRLCLHVITRCDDPANTASHEQEFYNRFKTGPDKIDPKIVVCTGIAPGSHSRRVTHGLDELVQKIELCLNPDHLLNTLKLIAGFILEKSNAGARGWNRHALGFDIPSLYLHNLKQALTAIQTSHE